MDRIVRQSLWFAALGTLLSTGLLVAEEAEDQYAVATGHYAARRWDLAAENFQVFAEEFSDHRRYEQALFYWGESLVQLRKFDDARVQFRRLLDRNSKSPFSRQALFRSGETAYLTGKLVEAQVDLLRFAGLYADDKLCAFAKPYLGEIALSMRDYKGAQNYFSEALSEFPEGPLQKDCQLGLARSQIQLERFAEAERLLRVLVEDNKSKLADQSQFYLGLLYYQTSRFEQALSLWNVFETEFLKSKYRARAVLGQGWALYRLQRYGEAQERFAKVVQQESVGLEAQYWLGLTHRAQKQWKAAAEILVSASVSAKKHRLLSAIRFHAGDSLLHVGDVEGAGKQFDALLNDSPGSSWADDALYGKLQVALEKADHQSVKSLAESFMQDYPDSSLKNDVYLLLATSLLDAKEYEAAAQTLDDYLQGRPDSASVPNAKAQKVLCAIHLDRIVEARKDFQELLEKHPDNAVILPTMYRMAEAAYASGDRKWAGELYQMLVEHKESKEHVVKGLSGLAWSKFKENDPQRAAEIFSQILKEHPGTPQAAEAAFARAQIYETDGNPDAALALYLTIIQDYSESAKMADALLHAARIHDTLQQDQQAVTLYRRLIKSYPQYQGLDAALYGLAWSLFELNQTEQSMELFARVTQEHPKSEYWADACYRLAKNASEQKHYDKSEKLLATLVSANPERDILAHALYLQGRVASRRELWEAVEQPMQRLVEELPESPLRMPAEYSIAEAAYRLDQFDKAGKKLALLVKQIEGRNDTWMAMIPLRYCQVLVHQKRWTEAQEVAEGLKKQFPGFSRIYEADYVTGRCQAALGKFQEARASYRSVIRSPQGSKTETAAMAQWMIGESYFHQKEYDKARREYLKTEILYAYPHWQAGALLQAGKCYELLGRWEEAARLYERIVKKYSNTKFMEDAKRRLRVAQNRATPALK